MKIQSSAHDLRARPIMSLITVSAPRHTCSSTTPHIRRQTPITLRVHPQTARACRRSAAAGSAVRTAARPPAAAAGRRSAQAPAASLRESAAAQTARATAAGRAPAAAGTSRRPAAAEAGAGAGEAGPPDHQRASRRGSLGTPRCRAADDGEENPCSLAVRGADAAG